MSTKRTIKKTVALLMALAMLVCCTAVLGTVQASADSGRVSMYLYEPVFSKYGSTSAYVYVQTKDNASNQEVYVHYNDIDGRDWLDSKAEYFTTLSDGSKIWKAHIASHNTEYAIKYVADGQTYWDNNNGKNYHHEYLGSAPITANRGSFDDACNFVINATLQNYAYEKDVVVRYTDDNWATYKEAPMSYSSTNENGTELWTTKLSVDSDKRDSFEYCIRYTANGTTYWANNFGKNYDAYYYVAQ